MLLPPIDLAAAAELLEALYATYGRQPFTGRDLMALAETSAAVDRSLSSTFDRRSNAVDLPRSLGHFLSRLSRLEPSVVGNVCYALVAVRELYAGTNRWRVERAASDAQREAS